MFDFEVNPMKKCFALLAAILLAACGDEVTQINQTGLEVYSAEKDLPECTAKNEGEQAWIKGEPSVRICSDGEWFALSSNADADFSCKTEELKDGSGLKIVCNGDSIGVVLNGKDGKDGEKGERSGRGGEPAGLEGDGVEHAQTRAGDAVVVVDMVDEVRLVHGPAVRGRAVEDGGLKRRDLDLALPDAHVRGFVFVPPRAVLRQITGAFGDHPRVLSDPRRMAVGIIVLGVYGRR